MWENLPQQVAHNRGGHHVAVDELPWLVRGDPQGVQADCHLCLPGLLPHVF